MNDVMDRKRADDLGDFEKVGVEFCLGRRRLTFTSSPRPCIGCAGGLGQMEKSA